MTNAYESGNQTGQTTDNVGQDGNGETQENSGNWEEQAKYFQSEKDKLSVENKRLKGFEEIGKFLESRPEVVDMIDAAVKGGQPRTQENTQIELSPEEFDPWEAYNNPSSKSYQFRQQEMHGAISSAVNNAVGKQTQQFNAKQGMNHLVTELKNRGFNDEQIKGFMDFTSRNPADYGLDNVINMYSAVAGNDTNVIPNSGLDDIRTVQGRPAQGGLLDGQRPQAKGNEVDEMWNAVMGQNTGGNKLP